MRKYTQFQNQSINYNFACKMITYTELKRNLKKDFTHLKPIKVFILADSSTQILTQSIRGYGYEKSFNIEITDAGYDEVDKQLFNSNSTFYNGNDEFAILFFSTEKLIKEFYNYNEKENFNEFFIDKLRSYILQINGRKKIVMYNFGEINDGVFGNYANSLKTSFLYQLRKINLSLMELAQVENSFYVCDINAIQNFYGCKHLKENKLLINADMVFAIDTFPIIAKHTVDIISTSKGSIKKCIILDLDNTLWGGIIGDDGIDNIQIGELGIGKAFTNFQLWLKQLKQRGLILAVCSKNNYEVAIEPFIKHPDMILQQEDIAIFVANWETKVDNIRYIQSILNIGFDSMVFIDDNPFERQMVKENIKDIVVPDMPEDTSDYVVFLQEMNLFETNSFTKEDTERTNQYREEASRTEFKKTFTNESDYLKSLEMIATVEGLNTFNIPRVAQLSQRSNQFNLRTVRYDEAELLKISNLNDYKSFVIRLKDKFGDHGIIAVALLEKHENSLFINSWFMSCRVLKRGMEEFILNLIIDEARNLGANIVEGEYISTQKNSIVKDLYSNLEFEKSNKMEVATMDTYK